jgi:hypothetical protein
MKLQKKWLPSIKINKVPGYGGIYWQYFEDSDKIKPILIPVCLFQRELYLKKNTDKGSITKKTTKNPLNIGDLVTVRLIISTKEDMEFVHLKT